MFGAVVSLLNDNDSLVRLHNEETSSDSNKLLDNTKNKIKNK